MKLYLMRHAEAFDAAEPGALADAARRLTPAGSRAAISTARALKALGARPARFGTSPLVRARETAERARAVLAPDAPLDTCPSLAPGGDIRRFLAWLSRAPESDVLVTGHMPDLSIFAARLMGAGARPALVMKKASVCGLAFDGPIRAGHATLEWLLQPRHLRRIDRAGHARSRP